MRHAIDQPRFYGARTDIQSDDWDSLCGIFSGARFVACGNDEHIDFEPNQVIDQAS